MQRIFVNKQEIFGQEIKVINTDILHHLRDVIKFKPGEKIVTVDDQGQEYLCALKSFGKNDLQLSIIEKIISNSPKKKISLTIACAIPKLTRMDDIVDRLTQLGVERIIPLITDRGIVRLDEVAKKQKHERWGKIALSSSMQSQRRFLPVVSPAKDFKEVIAQEKDHPLKLIPALFGKRKSLKEIINEGFSGSIIVLIGPEGDFSEKELAMAEEAGFVPVSLGENILRVELAAVAVASYILISTYAVGNSTA